MPRPHHHHSELTTDQLASRERWQARWNVPILLAALKPLFVNSPQSRTTQIVIGVGSWLVFVIDLFVQHGSIRTISTVDGGASTSRSSSRPSPST